MACVRLVVIEAWRDGIGDAVAGTWRPSGNNLADFAQGAGEVLHSHPARGVSVAGPALTWLASPQSPEQHAPPAGFGQPAVTVYRGEGFMVVLLFWVHESV